MDALSKEAVIKEKTK